MQGYVECLVKADQLFANGYRSYGGILGRGFRDRMFGRDPYPPPPPPAFLRDRMLGSEPFGPKVTIEFIIIS